MWALKNLMRRPRDLTFLIMDTEEGARTNGRHLKLLNRTLENANASVGGVE